MHFPSKCFNTATFTKEMLLDGAVIILKGTVIEKTSEKMTNPTGKRRKANGELITNTQIAEYTVEISEIYKGDYKGHTITVKTSNGYGLSPDLILYGEDEKNILATSLKRQDFEIGKECILLLGYVDEGYEDRNGYYTVAGQWGYYPLNDAGSFQSEKGIILDPKALSKEITASKGSSVFQNQPTPPTS